ncbi:MAG: hypothetical protein M1830_001669 [Pleopsidium flavum]|nr:MAG: hypothetical protein M1830_001669 [Pleopsidium flavum]
MTVRPAPWPPKPDLFDEVSWGPLPSADDYKLAYKLWSLPNANLAPNGVTPSDDALSVLVRNVYDHIVSGRSKQPPDEHGIDPNAQMNSPVDEGVGFRGWSYDQIFPNVPAVQAAPTKEDTVVDGHGWKPEKPRLHWTKVRLQNALEKRGLSTAGLAGELKDRLFDHEFKRQGKSDGRLPRANLAQWGIERTNQFLLVIQNGNDLSPLDMYTWAVLLSPYNPTYWTSRAYLFYQLGHFDLALGDAHRAFYLVEILHNLHFRTQQPGLYPCIWDAIEQHIIATGAGRHEEPVATARRANGINSFVPALRRTFHHIISLSLIALEAWEDYEEMDKHLIQRITQAGHHLRPFTERAEVMRQLVALKKEERDSKKNLWDHEKRMGSAVARRYPQSANDIDRTDGPFLAKLNDSFVNKWPGASENGPGLQVQPAGDSSLAVFASGHLERGVLIYAEEPSVRGQLARNPPSQPLRCENCKRQLLPADVERTTSDWLALSQEAKRENQQRACCACAAADVPLYFCGPPIDNTAPAAGSSTAVAGPSTKNTSKQPAPSQLAGGLPQAKKKSAGAGTKIGKRSDGATRSSSREEPESCLEIARKIFHHKACGRDWRWLHDAMQPLPEDGVRNPPVNHERHGTIFSLLLREVFDMTLIARREGAVVNLLAHEIDALLPLCGGEDMLTLPEQRFPFGFAANIVVPFDILLHLGINIFKDLEFDTWVIQTVLRKLLLNVVPWDQFRRGPTDDIDSAEKRSREHGTLRANFESLYIHTGFSMFNHACRETANAMWWWDGERPGIPNRIIVRTTRAIADGEEVRVHYFPEADAAEGKKLKLFGRDCDCEKCSLKPCP